MATFTNQAKLSYNGTVTSSNIITGELQEVLTASKSAVVNKYSANGEVTYVISVINSGNITITNLNITDNLGEYTFGTGTRVPLTYIADSVQVYVDGVKKSPPTVTPGPPLVFNNLNFAPNSDTIIIYKASVNEYAPLDVGSTIINKAVIEGASLSTPIALTDTVTVNEDAKLTISKSLSPITVTENGELTYTFTIHNFGNTAAVAADEVTLSDTFKPILNPIAVSFNNTDWVVTTNYTYAVATGEFATVKGQIVVDAATYTQNATTGKWEVTPGVSTLIVKGTV